MSIAAETIDERPTASVFSAGRMFYLVNNTIYYSQVMEGANISFLSKCYQRNDPTAEQLSDLLATDGGTIPVNSAGKGISIKEVSGGIAVFFDNGVWSLNGPDSGFTATNFSLNKITDNGCTSAQSIVLVDGTAYYWGINGIHSLSTNQFGVLEENSITNNVASTLYHSIPLLAKTRCFGFYNRLKEQIEWFYTDAPVDDSTYIAYSHDRGITYSLKTGGIFPQQFNSKLVESTTDGSYLVTGVDLSPVRDEGAYYLSVIQDTAGSQTSWSPNLGNMTDTNFQDFAIDYPTAYIETGYETLDKPSNKKEAPYVTTHFAQTEENWVDDGSGGLKLDLQSGCQMRAKWDWNVSPANGRWSPAQQAYRFRRVNIPSVAGPFDSGESVITTKNKMLGRGNSLSLRFEQEPNKDMQLLGYTVQYNIKARM